MSGPKVVRIVTREEIIATCKDILAQLEAEVRQWERVGRRNDLLSDHDIAATGRVHLGITLNAARDFRQRHAVNFLRRQPFGSEQPAIDRPPVDRLARPRRYLESTGADEFFGGVAPAA